MRFCLGIGPVAPGSDLIRVRADCGHVIVENAYVLTHFWYSHCEKCGRMVIRRRPDA